MSSYATTENLPLVIARVQAVWPEHRTHLSRRFADGDQDAQLFDERLATLICRVAGGKLDDCCRDYRWACERLLEEELFFRRHGRYRNSSFSEVKSAIYDNPAYMERWVNGLLLSQLLWANHSEMMRFYTAEFLPNNAEPYRHLEIGPGHGLLLHFAAVDQRCESADGWDVSPTSLSASRDAVRRLTPARDVQLHLRDATAVARDYAGAFSSLVLSEVLEHLEKPAVIMGAAYQLLRPGGRLFVNVPVNSPAPDHIFLWRTPEDVVEFVAAQGFDVLSTRFAPLTGYTLDQARRHQMTISCGIIARRGD